MMQQNMTLFKSLGKGTSCIIDSVTERHINISKDNPLAGSSYIKSPAVLDHPKCFLINIQNFDDNQRFK